MKFSIAIVVKNAVSTIEKAIQSVLDQGYDNFEFLVLDGGSTDGTIEVIKKYEQHITYMRSHPDDGPGSCYNEAAELCKGDVLAFLNADDWYEPNTFSKVAAAFSADDGLELVTCAAQVLVYEDNNYRHVQTYSTDSIDLAPNKVPLSVINSRFFKPNVFKKYGGMLTHDEYGDRIIADDYYMIINLAVQRIKNLTLDHVGYSYLAHDASFTFDQSPERQVRLGQEAAYCAGLFLKGDSELHPHMKAELKKIHRKGYERLFLWSLKQRDWKKAGFAVMQGMRFDAIAWLFHALIRVIQLPFKF